VTHGSRERPQRAARAARSRQRRSDPPRSPPAGPGRAAPPLRPRRASHARSCPSSDRDTHHKTATGRYLQPLTETDRRTETTNAHLVRTSLRIIDDPDGRHIRTCPPAFSVIDRNNPGNARHRQSRARRSAAARPCSSPFSGIWPTTISPCERRRIAKPPHRLVFGERSPRYGGAGAGPRLGGEVYRRARGILGRREL
jgi:hypothetical protein